MKTKVAMVLAGCCVVMGEAQALSVSYDQKITQGGKVISGVVKVKDELFRMEATIDGEKTVTIRNRQGTYTYMPHQGIAMKLGVLPLSQEPVQGGDEYLGTLRQRGATLIGSETVNGYACDVYRYLDAETGETTVWVWKEQQFPVKLVMSSGVVELSNIQLHASTPDAAFQLPAGVQVMDMGSMMPMP